MKTFSFLAAFLFPFFLSAQSPYLSWIDQLAASGIYNHVQQAMCDNYGRVIVSGSFSGTVDFNPSVATDTLTALHSFDTFIAKYDSSSNFVWAKNIGACNSQYTGELLKDTADCFYFLNMVNQASDIDPGIGVFTPTTTPFANAVFAKYDASGNFLWAKNDFGGGSSIWAFHDVAISPNGLIAAYFNFTGTIDADPGPASAMFTAGGNNWSGLLAMYDSNGTLLWAKQYDTNTPNEFTESNMAFTVNGTLVITGSLYGTIDADAGVGTTIITSTNYDPYIITYSVSGMFQWAFGLNSPGTDYAHQFLADSNGDLFISGESDDTLIDFDPSAAVEHVPYPMTQNGYHTFWLASYDSTGNFRWVRAIGNVSNANDIELDPWGSITFTTNPFPFQDFDPGPQSSYITYGNPCLFKMDPNGGYHGVVAYRGNHVVCASVPRHCYSSTGRLYMAGSVYDTTDFDFGTAVNQRWPSPPGNYDFIIASYRAANNNLSDIVNPAFAEETFHLYPNPASDKLTVDLPAGILAKENILNIYSIDGRKRNSTPIHIANSSASIDISQLEDGIYFLELWDGTFSFVQKFVVVNP